jgi:hypothetical protein
MKTYRLAPSGRRLTLTLMLGTLLLWFWVIWLVGAGYAAPGMTFRAALQNGSDAAHVIPAGVLLAMIVVTPLLLWSLWQEWRTSYTLSDDGLTYRTAAGSLHYTWPSVRGVEIKDDPKALGAVLVTPGGLKQIRNPLSRWLCRQTFGADRVPLYAGIENRDELVQEITRRIGSATTDGFA